MLLVCSHQENKIKDSCYWHIQSICHEYRSWRISHCIKIAFLWHHSPLFWRCTHCLVSVLSECLTKYLSHRAAHVCECMHTWRMLILHQSRTCSWRPLPNMLKVSLEQEKLFAAIKIEYCGHLHKQPLSRMPLLVFNILKLKSHSTMVASKRHFEMTIDIVF